MSQSQQHNSGSAAPPASGDKKAKASGFGARVVKAREKKGLKRTGLSFPMHAAACSVLHPEPYKYSDWPEACQKAADGLWNRIAAIEKGKARDPELEAELAQRLGIAAPKVTEKATAPAKATKPTVTLAVVKRVAAKQGGKFTPGSIRKALLGRDNGPNSHEVWHAVRKLAAAHPEAFEHISGHKYSVRTEQAAAVEAEEGDFVGVINDDGTYEEVYDPDGGDKAE